MTYLIDTYRFVGNYFGSGADGAKTVTTAEELTSSQDGNPAIKHYSSLTIDAAKSLTVNNRCKGLLIYVQGNCVINGHLKMDSRGASAAASEDLDLSRSVLVPLATSDIVASAKTSSTSSGPTRTVNLPTSGVSSGMMMFICMSITSAGDVGDVLTKPDGWDLVGTQVLPNTASTPRAYIYKRLVPGGGLGSTVDITSSDSAISHAAVAFAAQGVAEALDVFGAWNTGTGTTVTCPAVTASLTGGLTIRFGVSDDNDQGSQPSMSAHTPVNWQDNSSPGNGQSVYVWVAAQPSTSVGAATFGISNEEHAGVTFVLSKSGGGAGDGGGDDPLFPDEVNQPNQNVAGGTHTKYLSEQAGAAGGAGATPATTIGDAGSAGGANQTGGGGGGGTGFNNDDGAAGAAGTALSGGSGGGGAGQNALNNGDGSAGSANGGAGGAGGNANATSSRGGGGGGAGNPGGAGGTGGGGGNAGEAGANGTGGDIILVVGGDLTIGAAGIISADGSVGGAGGDAGRAGGGGGGSGGGRVIILYRGALSNSGTIRANGGAGGAGGTGSSPGAAGGSGGAGTVTGPTEVV